MDFNFNIFDYNIVEARNILLQIVLKLCESDTVAAISSFAFWLDNVVLSSPSTRDAFSMYNEDFKGRYELRTDFGAVKNKLAGLYVIKEIKTNYELREPNKPQFNPDWDEIEASYIIEPGLRGIKKCVRDITSLSRKERDDLPPQLKDMRLSYFRFTIGVVWDKDKENRITEDGAFEFMDHDRDYISGKCDLSSCWLAISSFDERDLKDFKEVSTINHLNGLQKILDEVAPEKFELRPEFLNLDLLNLNVLQRKGRDFYTVKDQIFKEAENRFWEAISKQAQEVMKIGMNEFTKVMAKYKEKESEDKPRIKEAGERLQALQSRMTELIDYTGKPKKAGENDENID